jgi:penicillin-binding protein 1B
MIDTEPLLDVEALLEAEDLLDEAQKALVRRLSAVRRAHIALFAVCLSLAAVSVFFGVLYVHYSRLIDKRLRGGAFPDSVNIYAAPSNLSVGDPADARDLITQLRTVGYRESPRPMPGSWRIRNGYLEIFTAREGGAAPVRVLTANGQIAHIEINGRQAGEVSLPAPLITTLSSSKEKRLLTTFSAIPPALVQAILSTEDKRFFQHGGLDLARIVKAGWVDFKEGRKEQGASTLTMQLVRALSLEPDKLWSRKIAEVMMTIHLEREWPKEKIFETYVNQVYFGRQADYSVHGFGQAARMYFGKELRDISLPEAALLAGLVQRPSYFNPFRYPVRAKERRDIVLGLMRDNRYINAREYRAAVNEPVRVTDDSLSEARAPWFVDVVNDELQGGELKNGASSVDAPQNVYSTIDLNLQRAAEDSVASGMQEVDKLLAKRTGKPGQKAEAALIALDPRTGEIKALVGGRDYRRSQFNRILAKRPPGSVFKPFVYAAALETALSRRDNIYTPASTVDDSPTTFWFGGKPYEPGNFGGEYLGVLTLREALARSDNVAAVKVAEEVGYDAVVRVARRMGLNDEILATPSVALGSYQVTPLEIAAAYTAFANGGVRVKPVVMPALRKTKVAAYQALDPRINWLMVNMLEEVMRSGTAAGVRGRGFTLPAGGKTGTSHDGWFAGFTSQLLCVVWVGFDDYRELNLEGAHSALPIWTEFMKRASRIGEYRKAKEFSMPAGISQARICPESGKLATPQCPDERNEYFIAGTEPTEDCDQHNRYKVLPPVEYPRTASAALSPEASRQ